MFEIYRFLFYKNQLEKFLEMEKQKNNVFAFDFDDDDEDEEEDAKIQSGDVQNDDQNIPDKIYDFDDFDEGDSEIQVQDQQKSLQKTVSKLQNQQTRVPFQDLQQVPRNCIKKKHQAHFGSEDCQNEYPSKIDSQHNQQLPNQQVKHAFAGLEIEANKTNNLEYISQKKAIKVTDLKQFLIAPLLDYKIKAIIKRSTGGIFNTKTKFQVIIEQNKKFILSVLRDGISQYIFSLSRDNISKKNKNYLGLLESNIFGTEFKFYDAGFNPSQTRILQHCRKQLASIKYEPDKGPRKFKAIVTNNQKGVPAIDHEEDVLENNWNDKNREGLSLLYSQAPEYDPDEGNYKLDFKGIVKKASVKNFILGGQQWKDSLVFGKIDEDTFIMEIKEPLSLLHATAICISSMHYKLK